MSALSDIQPDLLDYARRVRDEAIAQVTCSPSAPTSQYRTDFADWLSANMHIWRGFEAKANQVWARGRRHYSARTIIEVLRHESMLTEVGGPWKINDHYTPDLARFYMETYPERAGLFEMRVPRNARRAA